MDPATIAALYKARWEVELLFKELKQTLQLQDFYGENENAVRWQILAALLTHLMLRFLKFKAKANCSYTRFVGFVRAVVWLKKDLMKESDIIIIAFIQQKSKRNVESSGRE